MPLYDSEGYRRWKEQGIDIAAIFAEESRKRGIEAFYNYRINGSDNDLGPFSKLPMKLKHPEWLIHTWPGPVGLWNYAIPEVRRYKLSILREIAERFDYDGISLDFARVCPVLPPGKAWANRDKMNEFMREFRSITQQVAQRRGRPLLVGARIPRTWKAAASTGWISRPGSGKDWWTCWRWAFATSTWTSPPFALSWPAPTSSSIPRWMTTTPPTAMPPHRSTSIAAWPPTGGARERTASRPSTSTTPPIFPSAGSGKPTSKPTGKSAAPRPFTARTSGSWPSAAAAGTVPRSFPNPQDWTTPRWMYFNTNMLAPLPAPLANDGKADALLTVNIADDVDAEREHLERLSLRVLLSDPSAKGLPKDERLQEVIVATIGHPDSRLLNIPPAKGIENLVEARLNNALLGKTDLGRRLAGLRPAVARPVCRQAPTWSASASPGPGRRQPNPS